MFVFALSRTHAPVRQLARPAICVLGQPDVQLPLQVQQLVLAGMSGAPCLVTPLIGGRPIRRLSLPSPSSTARPLCRAGHIRCRCGALPSACLALSNDRSAAHLPCCDRPLIGCTASFWAQCSRGWRCNVCSPTPTSFRVCVALSFAVLLSVAAPVALQNDAWYDMDYADRPRYNATVYMAQDVQEVVRYIVGRAKQ